MPRPYRKKKFVEDDEPTLSHLRVSLLTFSGLIVASLIVALALLAKENFDAPVLPVVAAPSPPLALPAAPARALPAVALRPAAMVVPAAPLAPLHVLDMAIRPRAVVPHHQRIPTRLARVAHTQAKTEAAVADPDVVLITAILLLTPPSVPETSGSQAADCTTSILGNGGCPAIHGMKP